MTEPGELPLPQKKHFRFSLRTLFVAILIAAFGISLWASFDRVAEQRRLKGELTRLKNVVGELEIEKGQENKLHAVAIPTLESLTWKWNVHVPEGRHFWLKSSTRLDGKEVSISDLLPGRYTITVSLQRNQLDHWELIVAKNGGNLQFSGSSALRQPIPEAMVSLIEGRSEGVSSGVSGNTSVEPGNDLELLRHRMEPTLINVPIGEDFLRGPHEGILAWITEKP